MNNLKDLTVIIVTFKTNEEILFNCLDSIKKEVKILLIENSTNKEFKKKIEEKYNNVNVILSGKNLGYGGGNNLGLKNTKTRFALISNPDVQYNENFFDEIDLYLSGKINFSVIGPSYNDQTHYLPYGSFDLSPNYNNFDEFNLKEVDFVIGCSMLFDTKNINTEFYFDENFFLYFEEFDLCKSIIDKGGFVYTSRDLKIHHLGFQSSMGKNSFEKKDAINIKNWHWMWSWFYFYKKNYNFLYAFLKLFGKLIKSFIKTIFYFVIAKEDQKNKYLYRFLGLFNSIIGRSSHYRGKKIN